MDINSDFSPKVEERKKLIAYTCTSCGLIIYNPVFERCCHCFEKLVWSADTSDYASLEDLLAESLRIKTYPLCVEAHYVFRCGKCGDEFLYTITEGELQSPPNYCGCCGTCFEINQDIHASLVTKNPVFERRSKRIHFDDDSDIENPGFDISVLDGDNYFEELQKSKFREAEALFIHQYSIRRCSYCGHGFFTAEGENERENYCCMCRSKLIYSK